MAANVASISNCKEFGFAFRRTGQGQLFVSWINTYLSLINGRIGNFHRQADERIPDTLEGQTLREPF
jgi:hypothetical protein